MRGKIVLADPYLAGASGHCYPYFDAVRRCLARHGRASAIVGNRAANAAFLAANRVQGEFYSSVREWRPSNVFFGAIFRRNLTLIARSHTLDQTSLLIFNSLRPFHLSPLARWLRRRGKEKRPNVACILHFAPRGMDEERHYRDGFEALASVPPLYTPRLFADTTELQQLFSVFTDLPIGLAPIPSTCEADPPLSRASGPVRVAFAGEARWDKGFHLLPAAAEAIAQRPDLNADFVVQAFNPEANTETFASTIATLRGKGAALVEHPLSVKDYQALIQKADIILLPYSAPHYRFQSSGVYIDAVLSGKVTVAPSASWIGGHHHEARRRECVQRNYTGGFPTSRSGGSRSISDAGGAGASQCDRIEDFP